MTDTTNDEGARTLAYIEYLLANVVWWYIAEDLVNFKAVFPDKTSRIISPETLSVFHLLFPEAVKASILENDSLISEWIRADGRCIRDTAYFLRDGATELRDTNGFDRVITKFRDFSYTEASYDPVYVSCDTVTVKNIDKDGVTIPYVVDSVKTAFRIAQEEVTAQCSDWQQRYSIGQGLGMNDEELAAYVFHKSVTAEVDIGKVKIDVLPDDLTGLSLT